MSGESAGLKEDVHFRIYLVLGSILTDILRHEFGFDGLVLCEGGGLSTLIYERVAKNQKEAGVLALNAGVDVGISYEDAYQRLLLESVREELVSEDLVDRAVGRILEGQDYPRLWWEAE